MFFKPNTRNLLNLGLLILWGGALAEGSDINLGGKKDLVVSNQVRQQVLTLSEELLAEGEDDFVETIGNMDSPFVFEQFEAVVADVEAEPEAEPVINYDDASVLRVVAENFSRQVSGTMVRGSTSFLQLDGGTLMRPGSSFPVSIPQARDRTFTVIVSEITGNSYTLQLGDAEQVVRLNGTALQGGGASRAN